jgi:hypothetical protein
MPSELIPLKDPDPPALFAPGGTREIVALIEREARALVPDVSTTAGRDAVAAMAAKINRSKTYLDEIGKNYVAELKDLPKRIDAERKAMRDRLDALKAEIRQPLTAWEEAVRARQDYYRDALDGIASQALDLVDLDPAALLVRIECVSNVVVGPEWEEYRLDAENTKARALALLGQALDAAKAKAALLAAHAELEKARLEQERATREEQIRQEAANAARAATLAEIARAQPPEQEGLARPAPVVHRSPPESPPAAPPPAPVAPGRETQSITHRALLADLEDLGIPVDTGRRLITAIVRGQIPHLSITY